MTDHRWRRDPALESWLRAAPAQAQANGTARPTTAAAPNRPVRPPHSDVDHRLVRQMRQQVAELLADRLRGEPDVDLDTRREIARQLVTQVLADAAQDWLHAGLAPWTRPQEEATARAVMAALFGLGRLQALVDDPSVENIIVNGCDRVWVCYADGREEPGLPVADSDAELIEQLQLLAARVGASERTFTTATPSLHARLEDSSRLAAMAWTTPRPYVVIRRHRVRDVDLQDLVRLGTLDSTLAAFLRAVLLAGKNIVVTGLQNAGKTTLIRALANEFGPLQRFATIEREYELYLHDPPERHPFMVAMEAREGSTELDAAGRRAGEVTMDALVRDALRMSLRRVIIGEVRDREVLPMLEAMTTGDGSLCTIHARSAAKAIERIVTLCLQTGKGISDIFAYRQVAGAVDFIVHVDLIDEGAIGGRRHRFVREIVELDGIGESGRPAVNTVFGPGLDGRAVPQHTPSCLDDLIRVGFDPRVLDARAGTWKHPLNTLTGARGAIGDRGRRP